MARQDRAAFHANVDAIVYVAVSSAKTFAAIYTNVPDINDRMALMDTIEDHDGTKVGAINETLAGRKVAAIATFLPDSAVGG